MQGGGSPRDRARPGPGNRGQATSVPVANEEGLRALGESIAAAQPRASTRRRRVKWTLGILGDRHCPHRGRRGGLRLVPEPPGAPHRGQRPGGRRDPRHRERDREHSARRVDGPVRAEKAVHRLWDLQPGSQRHQQRRRHDSPPQSQHRDRFHPLDSHATSSFPTRASRAPTRSMPRSIRVRRSSSRQSRRTSVYRFSTMSS